MILENKCVLYNIVINILLTLTARKRPAPLDGAPRPRRPCSRYDTLLAAEEACVREYAATHSRHMAAARALAEARQARLAYEEEELCK